MQPAYSNPEQLNQPSEEVYKERMGLITRFRATLDHTIDTVYPPELSVIDGGGEQTPRMTGHLKLVGTENTSSPEPVQIEVDQNPLATAARKAADDARLGHEEWTQIPEDIDI